MAKKSSTARTLCGLVIVVVGAGLLWWGYQMSESVASQLTRTFSGSLPDEVMVRYLAGTAGLVAGLYLLLRK